MRIRIDITSHDYWMLSKYSFFHVPKIRRGFILNMIMVPVTAFILFMLFNQFSSLQLPIAYIVICSLLGGAIFDLIFILALKSRIKKIPADKAGILGEHIIEISEKGIFESTSVNEGVQRWNGVRSVEQNDAYIFVFLQNYTVHIIPKRAFTGQEEASEFFSRTVLYLESAKQ